IETAANSGILSPDFRRDLGRQRSVARDTVRLLTDPEIRSKFSPHEVDFLQGYNSSVSDIRNEVLDVLDLAQGITVPPKDMRVNVVVVRECGTVQTESGTFAFKLGQRYQAARSHVEHLIVQGYLEVVP
ncbi:DNA replication protein psf1, partial [Tulasnella sp. 417]